MWLWSSGKQKSSSKYVNSFTPLGNPDFVKSQLTVAMALLHLSQWRIFTKTKLVRSHPVLIIFLTVSLHGSKQEHWRNFGVLL